MGEAEQPGVQSLAWEGGNRLTCRTGAGDRSPGARAVNRIADQRMTEMGEMNPDLVGPTRSQAALELRRMDFEHTLDPVPGDRRFPLFICDDGHLFAVHSAAADVTDDLARRHGRHTPNKGGIGAIDAPCGKIAR